jgi:protein-disulfide isomerase
VVDQVLQAYPKEVKFVYKEFPLPMHANAMLAARAALAAGKQGKFWEMHDKLFANQRSLSPEKIKELAQEIGLDMPKFEQDSASPEIQQQINQEVQEGAKAMVRGTPSLYVNGKKVANRSVEGLKQMIDEALKEKKA